ncbi:ATP-binding protein [Longimicrobium sp.]|uniref:hybrid sensor histidine kinase/response regulator n=1 Tax=Longimicrobium sp. TaxID=2029185 RepID=UPI003B3A38F3
MSDKTAPAAAPPLRARILMVDDRPENLMALEAILESLGHDLVRANSGEEALRQVLLHDFAVILLDVQMPGMNGFETAQLIKSRERSSLTPIIFLTAISKDEQFVYAGYEVGAVDYMFKPFNPDVLRSKVAVFVDLYLKTEQLKEQEARLRESEVRALELQHRAELSQSEARTSEIVDSALEAIITFGDDRLISLFNPAAERTFGVAAAEAMGRPVDELFAPEYRGVAVEEMCAHAADRAVSVLEGKGSGEPDVPPREHSLMGLRASGETFPLEASVSCLQLDSDRLYTVIGRDVSERKRAEEELREQAESLARTSHELQSVNVQLQARQRELESAMASRSRFYASMSHELRTPINAILGYSALLLDDIYGPLNEQQARGIERANQAAKHLLELVNDILDLSKIEAGKIDLEIQTANFPALVQDLFVTVRPLADEHGSELSLGCEEALAITTDPRRVRQIILNMLSNAIKIGEGKPITVDCRSREDGGVEVDVRDEGRGIEPENLERIFDEFVQIAHPDQQLGTGLGLPISRRLAVLLGGSLTVESALGEGSTFRLSLPPKLDVRTLSATESLPFPVPTDDDPLTPASGESASDEGRSEKPASDASASAAGDTVDDGSTDDAVSVDEDGTGAEEAAAAGGETDAEPGAADGEDADEDDAGEGDEEPHAAPLAGRRRG